MKYINFYILPIFNEISYLQQYLIIILKPANNVIHIYEYFKYT